MTRTPYTYQGSLAFPGPLQLDHEERVGPEGTTVRFYTRIGGLLVGSVDDGEQADEVVWTASVAVGSGLGELRTLCYARTREQAEEAMLVGIAGVLVTMPH